MKSKTAHFIKLLQNDKHIKLKSGSFSRYQLYFEHVSTIPIQNNCLIVKSFQELITNQIFL